MDNLGKDYLEIVMETVLDGLITIDKKGEIKSFNQSAVRIFGYQKEEVIGNNVRMLMPNPYQDEHDKYLTNYQETSDRKIIGIGREILAQRKNGEVFPMELGVNEMEVAGEVAYVGTIRDISERKASEKAIQLSLERMGIVMETVLDGLITIDKKGIIKSFNQSAVKIFGYQKEEVIDKNIKMLMPNPYQEEHDKYLTNYQETSDKKIIGIGREILAQRKNGEVFPMELGVNEMEVAGEVAYVGTIRDISERKASEKAMQISLERLKISNQELDQFAYIASHDLKEPLRGLANNALFLQEDYSDLLGESGTRRTERIRFLCNRMEQLVDKLLYYSRLGRQELAISSTNLGEIVDKVKELTVLEESNANVIINIPNDLPDVICDKTRITELIRNLISNAIKYNHQEVKQIDIGVIEKTDPISDIFEPQTFYVKDNGIGISPEYFEDIFKMFKRLNEEDDDIRGSGVGLAFVKKIIERHNGSIWLESHLGEGTCFYFTLKMGGAKCG